VSMRRLSLRSGIIREVWMAVHGDDPTVGALSASEQHRVVCPYHFEKNPSCDVSISKNAFKCRACPAEGGVLDVVVLAGEARTRAEAITWLASRGVSVC
jgi:hypothetical protein